MPVPRVYLGAADRFEGFVGKVFDATEPSVATRQALMHFGRDYDGSVLAVAGEDDGPGQGEIQLAIDGIAELGLGYAEAVCHACLRPG